MAESETPLIERLREMECPLNYTMGGKAVELCREAADALSELEREMHEAEDKAEQTLAHVSMDRDQNYARAAELTQERDELRYERSRGRAAAFKLFGYEGGSTGEIIEQIAARAESLQSQLAAAQEALRKLRRVCDHEYRLAKQRAQGRLQSRQRGHVDNWISVCEAVDKLLERPCTCHPDDNPPIPCAKKYALSECIAAAKSG